MTPPSKDSPRFSYGNVIINGILYCALVTVLLYAATMLPLYFMGEPPFLVWQAFKLGWCYLVIVYLVVFMLVADDEIEAIQARLQMYYTRKEQERNPRPRFYQSVEARATGLTLRRGNEALTPLSSAHYAMIYKRLARKRNTRQWKITRNDLDVKHGGVGAFENLTAIYPKILQHWQWLKWIDEKDGSYYLNATGQAAFVENGRLAINGINDEH